MKNLIVEVTSRCNLSCPMCLRHSWKDAEGDMDPNTFRSLLECSAALESLNLTGYGEPFLHPGLIEMIRLARGSLPARTRIYLTSNGTLLDTETVRDAVEAGLDGITLSMDSLDPDAFQWIRGGASLSTVTRCLDELAAARERAPGTSFSVGISTVVMERNVRELPDLVRFAAEHRARAVWVNNLLPYTEQMAGEVLYERHSDHVMSLFSTALEALRNLGVNDGNLRALVGGLFSLQGSGASSSGSVPLPGKDLVLRLAKELSSVNISMGGIQETMLKFLERDASQVVRSSDIFRRAQEIAAGAGIELHLPLLIPRAKRECDFVRNETCFVTWDGWVRPCNQLSHEYGCFHNGRPKTVQSVSFGKLPEEGLDAVWRSCVYSDFREKVAEFPFSPCGDCGLSDGCGYVAPEGDFLCDCNMCEQPCGDCLWSRGVLQCP
ncbi:MAG: radical SAM protein [bacterium]